MRLALAGTRYFLAGKQGVHGGHHKHGQHSAQRHAAYDHPADLHARLGTGTGGQRQRQGPQHHGTGGHHDGSQALRSRFDDSINHGHALPAQLVGELDNQDAVLGDQPDQGDQADLRIHVERAATPLKGNQGADHGQRHRQHDHQRVNEALKLGSEHQENKHQRQSEDNDQSALGFFKLAGRTVELGGVAAFEHLGGCLV